MNELLKDVKFELEKLSTYDGGAKYKVEIKVPMSLGWIERMKFIVETNSERRAFQLKHVKNENGFVCFEEVIDLPTKALYHYYFSFESNHNFIYLKNKNQEDSNSISKSEMWKLSVNFEVPKWAQGKIMYHIFVDRFNRESNKSLEQLPNRIIHNSWDEDVIIGPDNNGRWNTDFYGGDLKGITEKLDYLNSLGVSIIYLSPIVLSQSNHRYDTADYEVIDPYAGTKEDLRELCNKAHELGIKIVLDAVFNHTGNDSKYFNEYGNFKEKGAFQGPDSRYYSFYHKRFANGKTYFDHWWGIPTLPVCDGDSKDWQEYIYGVGGIIDQWFSLGIDGLRLDVADELTDEFIEGIRKAVKRNKKDGFILGEVWENPMRKNRRYIESGKAMDSVMNYQLINALIRYYKYADINTLRNVINEIITEYPKETINSLMNFTSTHDITRAINIFGSNEFQYYGQWAWNLNSDDRTWQQEYRLTEEQYKRAKEIYASYIYTLAFFPGILSIFYGDEIGMQGMGNLANRRPYTWSKQDTDLLNLFQMIGRIRKKESALENADVELIDINEEYMMFKRTTDNEEYLAVISRSDHEVKLILPGEYENIPVLYKLKDSTREHLESYGGIVLKKVLTNER